ncbi:uncharacterized protein EV420DRAFT_219428 [Desarmillaria tabescens]|uniref:Glucose-methanol-choline oxidoreductase C-terminal domain-containing protein n=1 Tax=Armillaria tabescens TaxID=1929756 RepID=A0AA39TN69_ARMTA|nr:uncharacterized protein EV420DRAFT_219428 [Desarmillaria tabescens]KAK0460603.1 hypothetical protein EV420DRAFT_219428 [Desarmillaria tabescens]
MGRNRTGFLTAGITNHLGFLRVPEGILDGEPCSGNETAHYEFMLLNGLISEPIPPTGNFLSIRTAVLCPLSRSDATLNSPLDPPLINPNFFAHPQDLAIHAGGCCCCERVCQGTGMGWICHWRSDGRLLRNIRIGVATIYHPVGTASMSPADAGWGVANPDLKLKGAKGVGIVDASVLIGLSCSCLRDTSSYLSLSAFRDDITYTYAGACLRNGRKGRRLDQRKQIDIDDLKSYFKVIASIFSFIIHIV